MPTNAHTSHPPFAWGGQYQPAGVSVWAETEPGLRRGLERLDDGEGLAGLLAELLGSLSARLGAAAADVLLYEPVTGQVTRPVAGSPGPASSLYQALGLAGAAVDGDRLSARPLADLAMGARQDETLSWHREQRHSHVARVALRAGGQTLGAVALWFCGRPSFDHADAQAAFTVAGQMALAIRLDRRGELASLDAMIAERSRMAREIHDSLAQSFAAMLIQARAMEAALDEPELLLAHLRQIRALAREGLDEARRTVHALRPQPLAQGHLAAALRRALDNTTIGSPIAGAFRLLGEPRPLPGDHEAHLLRIAQEALSNALKYSGAREIVVTLRYAGDMVEVTVADDGAGFELEAGAAAGGFGLAGMRERAALIGAELQIWSEPGRGASVSVRLSGGSER